MERTPFRYAHVVFDFDGTLVDSLEHSIAAFQRIAPRFHLKLDLDLATARTLPTRELFARMGVRFWNLPRIIRAFQEEAAKDAPGLALVPGMAELLAGLAERGVRLGILSSNREDAIRACLRAHGVENLFAFVVGYPKLFGKAKALRRIRKVHRIDRDALLYVGDEARDVEAAAKAKVASAAVTWGFHAEALLAAAAPTHLLRRPGDLLELES
ncbi:MAG: HAD-IA family hydrolase [Gemmataceae bacterium]|nr:HAD-IA family hydrolase [Gemmataceae bacterium]